MVKPGHILVSLLVVNALLALIVFVFPKGEISLFPDLRLRFVSQEEVLHPKQTRYADISGILGKEEQLAKDSASPTNTSTAKLRKKTDSSSKNNYHDPNEDELRSIKYKIEYPKGEEDMLNGFFAQLDALGVNKKLIRIVHYGDSQLEGDRITGTFRYRMQKRFGCGTGTIPVFDASGIRSSVAIDYSDNWVKYAVYGGLYKGVKTKDYGMQGTIFRFTAQDSGAAKPSLAWVSIAPSRESYPNTKKFKRLTLYYATGNANATIKVTKGDQTIGQDTLARNSGFAMKSWPIDSFDDEIKLAITASESPDVYGIGLDGDDGVAVDNVSMRGSSGTDLLRANQDYLALQLKALGTKLILYEYGLNVVPYIADNYDYYGKQLYKQLMDFKRLMPGVPIVLILGLSDISTVKDGAYVSYPNIEIVRDAEKKAAFDAGCAYWDLYSAMGGKNSMPSWVNAKPSLAEKDFTHFNARGAKIIGQMMYNALISDYLNYEDSEGK